MTAIIVPTPSGTDGAFRNDYVLSVMDEVGRALANKAGYHLVVVHSTTMPGSVGGPIRQRLEWASGRKVGPDIGLCYNPEFIALGDVINGLLHPDFVLIGESDKKAGDLLEGVYRKVVGPDANVARMNFVNAELTKISVNTYVTMKISFANMLGEICDRLEGADVSVVADAIGRDTRIGRNIRTRRRLWRPVLSARHNSVRPCRPPRRQYGGSRAVDRHDQPAANRAPDRIGQRLDSSRRDRCGSGHVV